MYIAGRAEMQLLDQHTMREIGLPGVVLMENAGAAVIKEVMKDFPDKKTKIAVLAGSGNNGGDGFVIARRLYDFGYDIMLICCVEEEAIKGDARVHYNVYKNRRLPTEEVKDVQLENAEVIIDALLGTGLTGEVREPFYSLIKKINSANKYVYAVDIPSGVNSNNGEVLNTAVKADKTVTFVLPKKGFYLQQGPQYVGEVICTDISVPPHIVEELQLELPRLLDVKMADAALPKRPAHGHKGMFGHVLVIGGCRQYVGAPVYTAKAAFHTGAGLVTLAVPESIYPIVAPQSSECLFIPLQDKDGALSAADISQVVDFSAFQTVVLGPGLGRQTDGTSLIRHVLDELTDQTFVIDADGLYFAGHLLAELKTYKGNVIFTPHPGEMARLAGLSVKEVEENRLEVAKQFAGAHGIYLLLKGHRSIITTPSGEQWINPFGNDALGKGGSGDVLTGLIASFVSQGAEVKDALLAACYHHAHAAEQLGTKWSTYGVLPLDIIDYVRKTL